MKHGRDSILELDRRHVWRPYTPMAERDRSDPLVIERAQGAYLYDTDGRKYIDGNASWWTATLGHQHPRLLAALAEQSKQFTHVALAELAHEPAALLAQELCAALPAGLERVFYSDNGSTAVEVAIKMCLQYWAQNGRPERRRFLALSDAFHGETLGVTALGGVEAFRRPFAGVLMDCVRVPAEADESAVYERTFTALCDYVRQHADTLAGVVVEPLLQGAGGMRTYAPELLSRLRRVTAECDVFLIADEVFTGYGRTGTMWACEQASMTPDIICLAKGFTAGVLPMAATVTTQRVFDGFLGAADRALYYGHTYCGHALGAAVAREVLRVYKDEAVLEGVANKAPKIRRAMYDLACLPGVSNPRALGMMGAVQLGAASDYLQPQGKRVAALARKAGVYLRPLGNVIYVAPALNIEDAALDSLLAVVGECVAEVVSSSRT
jgi:adenosylmethionine-8-amino-7-oxononanoate aminotransferase